MQKRNEAFGQLMRVVKHATHFTSVEEKKLFALKVGVAVEVVDFLLTCAGKEPSRDDVVKVIEALNFTPLTKKLAYDMVRKIFEPAEAPVRVNVLASTRYFARSRTT